MKSLASFLPRLAIQFNLFLINVTNALAAEPMFSAQATVEMNPNISLVEVVLLALTTPKHEIGEQEGEKNKGVASIGKQQLNTAFC